MGSTTTKSLGRAGTATQAPPQTDGALLSSSVSQYDSPSQKKWLGVAKTIDSLVTSFLIITIKR